MPAFAANLTVMFTDLPFLDRFEAVEYLFPYAFLPQTIVERLRAAGLRQAMFNLPPGDWEAGERGIAALPDRFEEFESGVERAPGLSRGDRHQAAPRHGRSGGCRGRRGGRELSAGRRP